MTKCGQLVTRLTRWTGSATITLGAVAIFLTAAAALAALVLVFGASARLLIGWWEFLPK